VARKSPSVMVRYTNSRGNGHYSRLNDSQRSKVCVVLVLVRKGIVGTFCI
jgi:hypothetical protein